MGGQGEAAAEKFTRATASLDDEGWNVHRMHDGIGMARYGIDVIFPCGCEAELQMSLRKGKA